MLNDNTLFVIYIYIYNVFRTMCDNDLGVKIKDFSKKMTSKMIHIFKHANKLANISISKITTIHANSDDKSKSFERTTCVPMNLYSI